MMKNLCTVFGRRISLLWLPALLLALPALTSCDDNDEPSIQLETVSIERELTRVAVPLRATEGVLTEPNQGIDAWVCNSQDQVRRSQTNEFLTRYPEYLNVDFSKYSLICYRTLVLNYSRLNKVDYSFYRVIADRDEDGYGTYRINSTLWYNIDDWSINEGDSYIMQIGLLVPRISTIAPVDVYEDVQAIQ